MSRVIDFYFDFISPYAFFSAMKIEEIAERYDAQVEWHAMLLGVSVKNVMGLKPPIETPLKGAYMISDFKRLSALYDVPLKLTDDNFVPKPLPPARAFCWVKGQAPEKAVTFAKAVYHEKWIDGHDISDPKILARQAVKVGLSGPDLLEALDGEQVKKSLKASVDRSLARGVFGAPTFIVDDEVIWGHDRIWMLEHWLEYGHW